MNNNKKRIRCKINKTLIFQIYQKMYTLVYAGIKVYQELKNLKTYTKSRA